VSREHRSAPIKLPAPIPYKKTRWHISRRVCSNCTRSTKPPECPQSCAYGKSHACTQTLPNPRCRLQLRSPGRGDTLPDESV